MNVAFKLLSSQQIEQIVPLMQQFTGNTYTNDMLKNRFKEMFTQNYECAGIFIDDQLIGISGLWYCTRHYSGRSVEVDHVYIEDAYQGQGLGNQFFAWIYDHVRGKGCEAIELNTYVDNHASHKFYYNQGFKILGYHFVKKF